MLDLALLLTAFASLALIVHFATIALAWRGCRARPRLPANVDAPMISIIRPVCGLENCLEETLRSGFLLDYWNYELIFCVESADDPAIPLVRRLMAQHTCVPARLLIGRDVISGNPKLNNIDKGWRAAAGRWVVMADSNVLMPPDYLQRLGAAWDRETGLVCSPPIGGASRQPRGRTRMRLSQHLSGALAICGRCLGFGFAQGKTMLWRKADPRSPRRAARARARTRRGCGRDETRPRGGPPRPLGDARRSSSRSGRRRFAEIWRRQVRWARLRRDSFPRFYALEIATSSLPGWAAAVIAGVAFGLAPLAAVAYSALWYGAEGVLARAAGWHFSWRSPAASSHATSCSP